MSTLALPNARFVPCTRRSSSAPLSRNRLRNCFVERYDYALETIQNIPYDRWHEYDAEDTLRFFALRMHEAGLLNNNPNAVLAEHTDWRFVNELKRELKT